MCVCVCVCVNVGEPNSTIVVLICQDNLQDDEDVQAQVEAQILNQYQKDGQGFAEPQPTVLG